MSRYRRRGAFKRTTRRYAGTKSRARSQKFRVAARRKGYGRTSGYYGRYGQGPHAELKFHDLDIDDAIVASTGTINPASASCVIIQQGTTESTRLGRKITIKSINWRWTITLPEFDAQDTPGPDDVLRVILFQDKQTNGATATVTGILESADFQSFNNLANKSRFRTLMDRTYALNYQSLASDGAAVVSGAALTIQDSFFKKCNIAIEYDNTATDGSLATQRSNNIAVLLISSSNVSRFASKMRLRFSDQG